MNLVSPGSAVEEGRITTATPSDIQITEQQVAYSQMSSLLKLMCRFFGWNLVCWERRKEGGGDGNSPFTR
jgi:hypothetical protein